jgi:hypothetical protein
MEELYWIAKIEWIASPRRVMPNLGTVWIKALHSNYENHGNRAKNKNYHWHVPSERWIGNGTQWEEAACD